MSIGFTIGQNLAPLHGVDDPRTTKREERREDKRQAMSSAKILNVGGAIALWLVLTTSLFLSKLPPPSSTIATTSSTILVPCLLFFNNLNIFIAMCEIILGLNIGYIQRDYLDLREKYKGNEWDAVVAYLTMPLTVGQLFDSRVWCRMWSTYSLYDPSYQNRESFGFFIDFGNGMSTIPPSLLVNIAIVWPDKVSPLWVGCIGLAMYWQVMYGTMIYLLSFAYNRRYVGKSILEVCLFVGFSNSLWMIFPPMGMHVCVCMLRDGSMDVFRRGA